MSMTSRAQITGLPENFKVIEITPDNDLTEYSIDADNLFFEVSRRIAVPNILADNPSNPAVDQMVFLSTVLWSCVVVNNTNGIELMVQYSSDGGVTWATIGVLTTTFAAGQLGYRADVETIEQINTPIPTANTLLLRVAGRLSVPPTGANKVRRARAIFVLVKS